MRNSVQYLGFAGQDNLGDDAIRDVFASAWPSCRLKYVPFVKDQLIRRGIPHMLTAFGDPLLLGGGTLVGRDLWRVALDRSALAFRPRCWEMLGIGVEDPLFQGAGVYTSWEELRAWRGALDRFRHVTVRGPRSQEILAQVGIDSTVVGDPALLLAEPRPNGAESDGAATDLLVNLTCGEDQWGGPSLDWTPRVSEALAPLVNAGLRIEFVSMEVTDNAWNDRLARSLGVEPVIHRPKNHHAFFEVARRSRLVLGTRLHCNILAAAAGVPNISLEYRPKCRDFMDSIGAGELCFRVDRIDPENLRLQVTALFDGADAAAQKLERDVAVLRARLASELVAVGDALGVGPPT